MKQKKFTNIDVLDFMGSVVEKHTRHYQNDYEIDKRTLLEAACNPIRQRRNFVWLCRTMGTRQLLEKNVFLKETMENTTLNYYVEQESDGVIVFAIEITGRIGETVIGNVYQLGLQEYNSHVSDVSLPPLSIILHYERGDRLMSVDCSLPGVRVGIGNTVISNRLSISQNPGRN